jgi:hypothetical protein
MNCGHLESLIYPTSRSLLFLGEFNAECLYHTSKTTQFDRDWIMMTRCGFTGNALGYLLDARNSVPTRNISGDKLYEIVLEAMDRHGKSLLFDHVFHLIPSQGKWIMFDSYINCRAIQCSEINLDLLVSRLNLLQIIFSIEIWKDLTGCPVDSKLSGGAGRVKVTISESDYSKNYEDERFWRLVDAAKNKLQTGVDDKTLSLLSPSLDLEKAERYLDSLMELIPNRSYLKKINSYIYHNTSPYLPFMFNKNS